MSEIARHRRGGQAGRRAERAAAPIVQKKYITREIPLYELLNAEGLEVVHEESMTILAEIGIDFRYEPAIKLWREAGVQVDLGGNGFASPFRGTAHLTDEQAGQLLDGQWYINIHTAAHPDGEIRGQVLRQP